jgi:hypothetical protein
MPPQYEPAISVPKMEKKYHPTDSLFPPSWSVTVTVLRIKLLAEAEIPKWIIDKAMEQHETIIKLRRCFMGKAILSRRGGDNKVTDKC